jgi:hypothetical protein
MKLSQPMIDVLILMITGWELSYCSGFTGWYKLQFGKTGYGGKTKDVNANTVHSLFRRKLISQVKTITYTTIYGLTAAGIEEAQKLCTAVGPRIDT